MKVLLKKIGFFTAFLIPTLVVIGFYLGGYWNFLAIFFSFILMPVLDQSLGIDKSNLSEDEAKIKAEEFYYRFVTYVWTFVQVGFVLWGAYAVTMGKLHSAIEWAAFILSFSLVTG